MKIGVKSQIGKEDIKWWDGVNSSFVRKTTSGGKITLTPIGGMVDVAEVYGDGSPSQGAIVNAINSIGTRQATLYLCPGVWSITSNLTIPSNIQICPINGAIFAVSSGASLAIGGNEAIYPEWFGAKGDGVTDDTAAIQAAIDSIDNTKGGVVSFSSGTYKISSAITITGNNVRLKGFHYHLPTIKCYAAEAGIFFAASSGWIYSGGIENITIDGNNVATVGVQVTQGSEFTFYETLVMKCTTGWKFKGGASLGVTPTGLVNLYNCGSSYNTVGVFFEDASKTVFTGGNFYSNTTNVQFAYANCISFRDVWFETFTGCFLLDHTSNYALANTIIVDGCYFLSTSGGVSYDCRIFKSTGDNDTYTATVEGFYFNNNHIYLTAAKYLFEVAWGATFSTTNVLNITIRDNNLYYGLNTDYWFHTDVANNPWCFPINFDNNLVASPNAAYIPTTDTLYPYSYFKHNGYGYMGDLAAFHFELAAFTTDGTWRDLDLSAIIPEGVSMVHVRASVTDDAVGSIFGLRKNGLSNGVNVQLVATQVANQLIEMNAWIPVGSDRIIEYYGSNLAFVSINVAILGWQ